MKRTIKMLLAAVFGLALLTSFTYAGAGDPSKGQKIIQKKVSKACIKAGLKDGGVLAKKHTQAEWQKVYDEGKLNTEIKNLCPTVKPLKDKYVDNVFAFLHFYANDSGNVPS
jgi:hypothetical protein